jgi:hypothetical protein
MSNVIVPMVALGGISYANNWYNTGNVTDVKPLLFAGVAGLFLEAFAAIPGMAPTATLLGWTAVIGMFLSPVQNPSPIENLLSLGQGTKATPTKKKAGNNG